MTIFGRLAAACVLALIATGLTTASSGSATVGTPGKYSAPEYFPLRGSHVIGCTYNNGCSGGYHGYAAIDIAAGAGESIYPAGAGKVVEAVKGGVNCPDDEPPFDCGPGQYANYVTIEHGDGVYTKYAHFSTVDVSVGDWVDIGDRLGGAGNSGPSTPSYIHLHFERRQGSPTGIRVDAGQLRACNGGVASTYPAAWGYSTWNQVPHHARTATNGGCAPSAADADLDGIPDSADQCPDEPGPASTGGCPDSDGDNVANRDDRCGSEPGEAAELGCMPQLGMRIDVNRDGRTDVVHRWSQGVNTWLSNGDGTWTVKGFQAHSGYGYTDGVWLTADVNGDARTDLLHRWSQGVNTWLSKGDGTWTVKGFQAHSGYGYSDGVWRVADVNRDGRTDLIHRWSQGVNTWVAKADGTWNVVGFQAHAGYGYADGVWRVADVNRDGRSDLVHRWSQGVNTWLAKGDGTWTVKGFQAHSGYGYTDGVWLTADVNGDLRTDLVHRWSGGVNTWLAKSDGTWTVKGFQAHAGYGYSDGIWRAVDVNKDGKGDLVHRWSQGVNTWLAKGDGSWTVVGFQAQAGYGYGQGTWLTVDQNADGRTDLVHRWQDGVNTWLSKGDGTWTVKGFQSHAGYGYGDGVWPSSVCCAIKVVNLVRPTIAGTKRVGSTLTATVGSWAPSSLTYRYTWLRDGAVIAGASSRTYRLVAADRGHRISVRVAGARAGYASTASVSLLTRLVRRRA